MKTITTRSLIVLTGTWLTAGLSALAESPQPTAIPAPTQWIDIRPTTEEVLAKTYGGKVYLQQDFPIDGVPARAVLKAETEWLVNIKNSPIFASAGYSLPAELSGKLDKSGIMTTRTSSFVRDGFEASLQWKNQKGIPVLYLLSKFPKQDYGYTTANGKRAQVSEDVFKYENWIDDFAQGSLNFSLPHPYLPNETVQDFLKAKLKGKVYFVPTSAKQFPAKGVSVTFNYRKTGSANMIAVEVKGCTTQPIQLKLPPNLTPTDLATYKFMSIKFDPSAQYLCPR